MELERILRLTITSRKAAHVRELVRPMPEQGDAYVLLQALNDQPSFLFLAVKEGHVEVVRALLEVGGRELAVVTRDNGVSCLYISDGKGHLDVVKALLEAGGRELVMLTRGNGVSCLLVSVAMYIHISLTKKIQRPPNLGTHATTLNKPHLTRKTDKKGQAKASRCSLGHPIRLGVDRRSQRQSKSEG